ncbi:MAG: manganese catalase family protein [Alkaliphilus sp.]
MNIIQYTRNYKTIPTDGAKGLLTNIGTEELAHVEMICTMMYQLTKDATPQQIEESGLGTFYAIRENALFPADPKGVPWTASYIQAHTDPVTELTEALKLLIVRRFGKAKDFVKSVSY